VSVYRFTFSSTINHTLFCEIRHSEFFLLNMSYAISNKVNHQIQGGFSQNSIFNKLFFKVNVGVFTKKGHLEAPKGHQITNDVRSPYNS